MQVTSMNCHEKMINALERTNPCMTFSFHAIFAPFLTVYIIILLKVIALVHLIKVVNKVFLQLDIVMQSSFYFMKTFFIPIFYGHSLESQCQISFRR